MKILSVLVIALSLGLTLATPDAEAAKRLGGGKSTGMQRQTTTEKAPAATPAQPANSATSAAAAPASAAATAAAAPKRSWMGPLAGIAAGLGLAALASHFGFGEQMANMLMMGLLVFAVLAVVGFIMRKRAMGNQTAASAGGMQYAAAGANSDGRTPFNKPYDVSMPAATGASLIGANLAPTSASNAIPADFDMAGFARNAKVQFIRLQAANDVGNLADIRDFTTPEMFAELKMDITDRGGAQSKTDVVSVNADIISVTQDADQHVVSVRFTGTIRDEAEPQAESFDETWHLVKPLAGGTGWLLSGIQQNA